MNDEQKVVKKKSWLGRLVKLFLWLLLILVILYVLLQQNATQKWIAGKVTSYLSDKTESEVAVTGVDFSITRGIELEGFLIKSLAGDTLISTQNLSIGLHRNLLSLWDGELDLTQVSLDSPRIKISTEQGASKSDLALLIGKLASPNQKQDPAKKNTIIRLQEIDITNLSLSIADANKNTEQVISVEQAYMSIDKLLEEGKLFIDELKLTRPVVRLSRLGPSIALEQKDAKEVAAVVDTATQQSDSLWIRLGLLEITDGLFAKYDATKKLDLTSTSLDYDNFQIEKIDLSATDLEYKDGPSLHLQLDNISFTDNKGLSVRKLAAGSISFDTKEISLQDFELVTDNSQVARDIKLTYKSLADFGDVARKVYINADLINSRVYVDDLLHYAGGLKKSPFFSENRARYISLSGQIRGPIDRLSGKNVEISVGKELVLKANFSTRNLTKKENELINFGVKELVTDVAFLKDFIPGFSPPANFYKLGKIDFKGRFDGYLKDFVAFGSVSTALGDAFLDMSLDVKEGVEMAKYSGDLSLEDFDLRSWSDNEDFGIVNFSAGIDDGRGLTLNSVDTELNAIVESITYKGYEYKDFVMDGHLSKNQFDGEFSITDENIDLIFDGNVELIDSVPHLDFKANIEKIDFAKLNLMSKPFALRGSVDINGSGDDINNLVGSALASDLYIATNDTVYILDTLSVKSVRSERSNSLSLYSDVAKVNFEGEYDLKKILPSFKRLLKQNYPHYTQNWNVDTREAIAFQDVAFDLDISDTKNLLELVGVMNLRVKKFRGVGSLNTATNSLNFDGVVPFVAFKNNTFSNTKVVLKSRDARGDLSITVDSTVWGGRRYNPIEIQSKMQGDTVNLFVGTSELADSLEKLELAGQLVPHELGYSLQLANKQISMLGESWRFSKDNELVFGKEYINIDNLRLSDGKRAIIVDDVGNKGLSLYLSNFDFKSLQGGVIKYNKMNFAGKGDLSVFVDDLFVKDKAFEANVYIPSFTINDDPFGTLEVDVVKNPDVPFDVGITLGDSVKGLFVDGTFDPDNDNYLDAKVRAEDFQLGIFEYILEKGISDVVGEVDLTGTVKGPFSNLDVESVAYLNNASLKILYTGATYTFDQQKIITTEKAIDFTGAQLFDVNGNSGTITGGIYHDLFTNFGVNANISGDDVVAVDTKKGDNELYYGYAKGKVSVDFTGSFDAIDMKVECTTKSGTVINIPISDDQTASEKNFIEFIDGAALLANEEKRDDRFKVEGLDIEIDLTLTEDAQVNLIFDESRGDIIQGKGNGDLKMYITRYGDYDMYGTYDIVEGNYLFTAFGLVAKPFKVRRGSNIRWTGDPINAELAINADYSVRTPMQTFLSEYLIAGTAAAADANNRTVVELILNLSGTLYNPLVSFDLDFPDIQGELASVADSKMRALRGNQADLNNQVLGLIVFNTFLPTNAAGNTAGADIGAAGVSTLSEFLSSQLSILFTGLINDALTEDGLISGIDFEIGLNKNSFNGVNQGNDILPDEIEVNLKNRFRFLDERLSLGVGGNYVRQSVLATNNNYFVGDFVIEYFLSSDRKLKLKMYGKYDVDENVINSSRRQKYGIGIGYRTEFGSLTEFQKELKKQIKEDLKSEAAN